MVNKILKPEALPDWPMFGVAEDVRPAMRQARDAGHAMVLATLVAVAGGGPRPEGTQMVFAAGVLAGYFSGGCVEGDVAGHAWACLADGQARTLVYGDGSPWPDIRLLCGARIEIFLERVAADDDEIADQPGCQGDDGASEQSVAHEGRHQNVSPVVLVAQRHDGSTHSTLRM